MAVMDLDEILNNQQYRIKLGLKPYLASGINIIMMLLTVVLFTSLVAGMLFFLVISIFSYKFFFNLKRDGDHFLPFVYKKMESFSRKLRGKLRKRENF